MAGTRYRMGALVCGCIRSLTGPEVEAADENRPVAGCIRETDDKPTRQLVRWVPLDGVKVKPHRCSDGPPPPPPGVDWLPELPAVRRIPAYTTAADAQGNILHERDRVVAIGTFGQVRHTVLGIEVRKPERNRPPETVLNVGRRAPVLADVVVLESAYRPFVIGTSAPAL